MDLKEIAKKEHQFNSHVFLDDPVPFSELFKDKNINVVDVYSIYSAEIGSIFCGTFRWKNNDIRSLDGDTYNRDTLVYAYKFYESKDKDISGLSILVGTDW